MFEEIKEFTLDQIETRANEIKVDQRSPWSDRCQTSTPSKCPAPVPVPAASSE